jgi:hypothetical protein
MAWTDQACGDTTDNEISHCYVSVKQENILELSRMPCGLWAQGLFTKYIRHGTTKCT